MNTADFLYYYAKLYNQYNVKAVLMRESWDDKDCDAKYAKYMQEYLRIKKVFEDQNLSDDKIKAALEGFKKDRLQSTYDYLYDKMLERLEKEKGKLSDTKQKALKTRLDKCRNLNDTDFQYIYEIRKIEEEEY
jgi:hypothetical protein